MKKNELKAIIKTLQQSLETLTVELENVERQLDAKTHEAIEYNRYWMEAIHDKQKLIGEMERCK